MKSFVATYVSSVAAMILMSIGCEMALAQSRIVGGVPSEPNKYPWMAALVDATEPSAVAGQFCGGSLIAPDWVLTAAHCVEETRPESIDVVLNEIDLRANGGERISMDAQVEVGRA